jgi:hypothetical protein
MLSPMSSMTKVSEATLLVRSSGRCAPVLIRLPSTPTYRQNPANPAQEFHHGRKRFDKHADRPASIR